MALKRALNAPTRGIASVVPSGRPDKEKILALKQHCTSRGVIHQKVTAGELGVKRPDKGVNR